MNINNSNQTIRSEQSSQNQSPIAETENYTIQNGDTLSGIARRLGVKIDTLLDLNPQITDANLIYAGHNIKVPKASNQSEQEVTPPTVTPTPDTTPTDVIEEPTVPNANLNPENNAGPTLNVRNYEIQSGDTLTKIASNHQTTVPAILALNQETITDPDKIYAGATIKIPVLDTPEQSTPTSEQNT